MSAAEIVGLALTVAAIGGAIGVAIGAVLGRRASAREKRCERLGAVCSRWLAARWTMSRASMSFVAAFRALAAERRESPNHGLRESEAQRSRTRLCEVTDELDRAEAAITVLGFESRTARIAGLARIDADELRAVIQGDQNAVEAFRSRLRGEDQKAAELVRNVIAASRGRVSLSRQAINAATGFARRIADQWSRG